MSVPYGQSPAAQQPGPPDPSGGLGLGKILAIVTGGLGLVIYLLSFSDDVGVYLRTGPIGVLLLGGALLAAASALPKAPATLIPAAVLVVTGTLFLLVDVTNGPAVLGAAGEVVATPGLVVTVLLLAFLESAACAMALLAHAGLVTMPARSSPYPQPSWAPPPGGYPGGPVQGGGYPGQPPPGRPPAGLAQPPQQPYPPHAATQYNPPGPYSGQSAQHGDQPAPYGDPPYSEPRYGEAQYSEQPTRYTEQPGRQGQHGGQPGTPPGSTGAPDNS